MKSKLRNIITIFILCLISLNTVAQTDSIFWFAVPLLTNKHDGPPYADLTITARDTKNKTSFKITQPYNPSFTILDTIDPSVSLTKNFNFPQAQLYNFSNNLYDVVSNSALYIKTDSNKYVNAYFEFHRGNNNPDIFSLKGGNALGQDFWIPFQKQWSNQEYDNFPAFSQIVIVATMNNTSVTVTFKNDEYGYAAGTHVFNIPFAGQTLLFAPKLNAGDIPDPSKLPADRLAGTHIVSNKPISVTIGDDSVIKGGAWDYIGDQMVPVINVKGKPTIGLEYVVMKGRATDNGGGSNEKVYVLTTKDNTTITYKRKSDAGYTTLASPVNSAGTQYTINLFDAHHYVHIIADYPVYILHVTGKSNELGGAIVPTIDGCTGSKDVTFVRSKEWTKGGTVYNDFYLNIMTHQNAIDSFKVSVDGGPFERLYTGAAFEYVGVSDLYVLKRDSSLRNDFPPSVPLRVKNLENVFHIGIINGVNSGGGCAYGYFSDYTFFSVEGRILQSGTQLLSSCYGNPIQLEVTEGHNSYEWTSTPASSITYLDDPTIFNPSGILPVGYGPNAHKFECHVIGDCSLDTILKGFQVEVYPQVDAKFNILPSAVGCAPYTIDIENVTTVANDFSWDFEDDRNYDSYTTDNSFQHTYQNNFIPYKDTVYRFRLYAENDTTGCSDQYVRYVRVHPEINAAFTANPIYGCNPLPVTFTDNSSGNLDTYIWKFGDGRESYVAGSVSNEYSHIDTANTVDFFVELETISPYFCRDTARATISVYSYLESEFTIDTAIGCSPLEVTFTNVSAGESQITLDYGDLTPPYTGAPFTSINHTYTNTSTKVDTFIVVLTAINDSSCIKTWNDTIIVYPEFVADYDIDGPDNYEGCNTRDVIFTNTTTSSADAASIFLWTFGDGSNSSTTAVNVPHTYTNNTTGDKTYDFTLHAESKYGCFDDTTDQITIYRAKADFTVNTDEGCSPLSVTVANTSIGTGITTWNWDFDDLSSSNLQTPVPNPHIYNNTTGGPLVRNLELTVTGTNGCSTSKITPVTVYSSINLTFTPNVNQTDCDSLVIPFNSTIVPNIIGTTYLWNFGDGTSSSVADISHTFRNFTGANVTYPVSLLAETPNGCKDTEGINVTVRPYVNAKFTVDKVTACSPMSVDPYATSYLGIATYRWDFGDATAIETGQNPLAHDYPVNTTGADANYTLQLQVLDPSGLCSDIATKNIKVYSEANADFNPKNTTGCNPYKVTFDNLSFNAATYKWDFKDGTTSAEFEPEHTFTNTVSSTTTKTYNVELEVTSNRGCTDIFNSNVSVYRYVEANFDIDVSEGCSPLTVNITNNSKGGTYRWYWNSIDGSGVANSTTTTTGVTFSHIYTNNSGNVQTVYLTCIAQNAAGCTDTLTMPIIVQSAMNAQFVSLSGTENCAPFTVNFDNLTASASDAQYFTWDFGDGTTGISIKASPDISHQFTNTTDADITRTVKLTAESVYGCPNSTTLDIKIYRRVIADFELNTNEDCSPAEIEITNKSKGGTYEWSWDNPPIVNDQTTTDATVNPILHTYTNTSQADVIRNLTVVAKNGHPACNKTLSKAITVHSSVVADFAISDAANCNPLTSTFSPTVSADAADFYWYYTDGTAEITSAASPNATHIFNNSSTVDKTFKIKMLAETVNGCIDSIEKSIMVYSYLDANFAMESSSGCPPFTTTIENTSFGNPANTYDWLVNGVVEYSSTGLLPFTHTYDNTNPTKLDYDILLHAENVHGCVSEYTGTITVAEDVDAIFSMTNNGCTPLDVTFTNNSIAPSGTLYYWDFKDGSTSTLQNPATHTYYNPSRETDKTFNVELSIITPSYCTDDTSAIVTVYHQPLAQFFIDKTSSCPPLISSMDMNESLGEDSWEWRFGDGSFNTSEVSIDNYVYQNTVGNAVQNYKLELWVGTDEGCKDSSALTLNVYPEVTADFTYDIAGCSPFVSQFVNTSTNANYYNWNFADGNASNQKNPTNRFDNTWDTDRIYKVYLKASSEYNCWDTITHPVTVYVQPTAEFDVNPTVQKFPENRAFIDNLTEPNTGPFNYLWEFGNIDESTSNDIEPQYFDYEHWGEKKIKLTVTSQSSDCNDSISKKITILPPDVNAAFITDIDGGCLNDGLLVNFTASQSAYAETYSYEWDFGDGSTPEFNRIVSHTYEAPGVYYVKLTATSNEGAGEDYEYKTIRVYSNPDANFEVSPKLAMLDLATMEARVKFYNLSLCNDTAGCAYLWNFGDGETAISRDVTHAYDPDPDEFEDLGDGTYGLDYSIQLVVTTANGCVDSLTLYDEVRIVGAGQIAFPNAFVPLSNIAENRVFRPVSEGVIEYELLIYNRWGELIFTTKDLNASWDGTIKGELAKPDVYVWKARGKFTNGRSFEIAGDVTLIR